MAGAHHTLPDGTAVLVRPLTPQDRDAFLAAFAALSQRTRYTRFLTPMDHLTSAEVDYFIDVDHHDHEALVAVVQDDGEPAGVARFIRATDDPTEAEVAFTVADRWQGRGVGTVLLQALADHARRQGITTFTAEMLHANDGMRALFSHLRDAEFTPAGDGAMSARGSL